MGPNESSTSPKSAKESNVSDWTSSAPSADSILRELHAAGIRLALQDDRLNAFPASCLTDEQRTLIRAHKAALVKFLTEAHHTAAELIEAAMRACDHWNDGSKARAVMRRDCNDTPPHLRDDLRDHFNQTYPGHKP